MDFTLMMITEGTVITKAIQNMHQYKLLTLKDNRTLDESENLNVRQL